MSNSQKSFYPPVVSVLGHVDHGKTTLLDVIRKSNIAAREHGGITQKIGASTVEIMHDGQKRKITFIDTPGHKAFSKMRSRGSQVADIGLLIVSSVDGVMPQTEESIQLLQKDKIPFIVVLTKSDSPEKNPEKVKQQLIRENVLLEGYGGDVPVIEVSARTNQNITELLDLILLVFELKQSTAKSEAPLHQGQVPDGTWQGFAGQADQLKAIVIESKLDPKSGPRATIVIKNGSIAVKDEIHTETTNGEGTYRTVHPEAGYRMVSGKVRSLITDAGQFVQKASIGEAVEVLGFEKVPEVGSIVRKGPEGPQEPKGPKGEMVEQIREQRQTFAQAAEGKTLSLILVADTQGSLEAIVHALPKEAHVIAQKTGEISEADILYAKSTDAIVLSFNIKLRPDIIKFATTEKVLVKNYTIVYEMLNEIQQVIEGKQLALMEQVFGTAKLLATFPFEKTTVLGIKILEGRVARGDKVRIMHGEQTVGESSVVSLRQEKTTTSKVEEGQEAGIIISPRLDITIGDMLVFHS